MAPKVVIQDSREAKRDTDVLRRVYLVTIPHPRAPAPTRRLRGKSPQPPPSLAAPSQFSRAQIEGIILDATKKPACADSRNQHRVEVELEAMAAFQELHQADQKGQRNPHYHIALKAARSFRFLPVKRAIRDRYNLETHWSCVHDGYPSTLRYCAMPSPSKPISELDPSPRMWSRSGTHRPLFEACQEPVTVAATMKRREMAVKFALEEGKAEPRPTEMDMYAAIVNGGFKNTPDDQFAWKRLVSHLKQTSPPLYHYAFKNRVRLPALIDDVWSWEQVEDSLASQSLSRVGRMQRAATRACECGGEWRKHEIGRAHV